MSRREETLWSTLWFDRERVLRDQSRAQHKALFISRKKTKKSPLPQQARTSTTDPTVQSVSSTDQVLMTSVDDPTHLSKEAHYAPVLQYYAEYTKMLWQAWHKNSAWRRIFKKSEVAQVKYAQYCQKAVDDYDALSGWFKGLRRLVKRIFGIENKRRIARAFGLHNAVSVVARKLNPSDDTRQDGQENRRVSVLAQEAAPTLEAALQATVDATVETEVRPDLTPRQWPSVAESETLKQAYVAAQHDKKLAQGLTGTGVVYGMDFGIICNLRALSDDRTIEERRAQYQQAATSDPAVQEPAAPDPEAQQHPVPASAGQDPPAQDQPPQQVPTMRADRVVEDLCEVLRRCVRMRALDFFTAIDYRVNPQINTELCQRLCDVLTQEINGLMQEHRAVLQNLVAQDGVAQELSAVDAYNAVAQRIVHAALHFFNSPFLKGYWQAKNIADQLLAVLKAVRPGAQTDIPTVVQTDTPAVVELRAVHTHLLSEGFRQALSSYDGDKKNLFNRVVGVYSNVLEEYQHSIKSNVATLPARSVEDDEQTYDLLAHELNHRFTQVHAKRFKAYETAILPLLGSRQVYYQTKLQQAAFTLCDELAANCNYVLPAREINTASKALYGLEAKAQADMSLVLRLRSTKQLINPDVNPTDETDHSNWLGDLKAFEEYLKLLASNIAECKQFIDSYQVWQRAWLAWKDQHERGMNKLCKFKKSDYTDPATEEARRVRDLERAWVLYEPIDRAYQAIPEFPIKPSFNLKFYYYSDWYSEENKAKYPHSRRDEIDRNQFWKRHFNSGDQMDCIAIEVRGYGAQRQWYLVSQVKVEIVSEIVYELLNLQESQFYADYEPCILRLQLNERGTLCRQMDEHYLRVLLADLKVVPPKLFSCTGVQESWLKPLERPMQQMMMRIYERAYLPVWQLYLSARRPVEDLRYDYYRRFMSGLPDINQYDTQPAEEMDRFAQTAARPEVIVVPAAAASSHEAGTTAGAITVYGHTRDDRESDEAILSTAHALAALQGGPMLSGAMVIYGAPQDATTQHVNDVGRAASRSAPSPFAHLTADNSAWSLLFKTIMYRSYPPLPDCVLQLEPEEDTDSPLLKTDLRYLRPILIKRFELFEALYAFQFRLAEVVRDSACIDFDKWVDAVQSNEELKDFLKNIEKQYKRFSLTAHPDKVSYVFSQHYDAEQCADTLETVKQIFTDADRFYRRTCDALRDPQKLSRYILNQYMRSVYSQEEAVVTVLCRKWHELRMCFGVEEVEQFKSTRKYCYRMQEIARTHMRGEAEANRLAAELRQEIAELRQQAQVQAAVAQVKAVQQENAVERAKRIKAERRAQKLQKKLKALGVPLEESDSEPEPEAEAATAAMGTSAAAAGLFAHIATTVLAGEVNQAAVASTEPAQEHTAVLGTAGSEDATSATDPADDADDEAAATSRPSSPGSTH